jgi:hypothetical protein
MRRGDALVAVLNQVEVFDEQIMSAWSISEQLSNLFERREVELPPLRKRSRSLAATTVFLRVLRPPIDGAMLLHATVSFSDECPTALTGLNTSKVGDTSP